MAERDTGVFTPGVTGHSFVKKFLFTIRQGGSGASYTDETVQVVISPEIVDTTFSIPGEARRLGQAVLASVVIREGNRDRIGVERIPGLVREALVV